MMHVSPISSISHFFCCLIEFFFADFLQYWAIMLIFAADYKQTNRHEAKGTNLNLAPNEHIYGCGPAELRYAADEA